jgi:hypothetical protein
MLKGMVMVALASITGAFCADLVSLCLFRVIFFASPETDELNGEMAVVHTLSFLTGGLAAAFASLPLRWRLLLSMVITTLVLGTVAALASFINIPNQYILLVAIIVCPGLVLAMWCGWVMPLRLQMPRRWMRSTNRQDITEIDP